MGTEIKSVKPQRLGQENTELMRSLTQAAAGEWLGLRHHHKSGKIKKIHEKQYGSKITSKKKIPGHIRKKI